MNERKSRIGFYLVVLLTCLSFLPLRSLRFEFRTENFFPAGDPELVFFREFQEKFSTSINDEFIFIGLRDQNGIFNRSFLEKTDSLTRYIAGLNHILKIYSLTNSQVIYFKDGNVQARPLVQPGQPEQLAADSQYIFRSPEYRDLLVSSDSTAVAVAAFNEPNLTNRQKDLLLDSIRQKLEALHFDESHLTAKIRVEREYDREITRNLKKYMVISLCLISLFLFLLFRSVKAVLLPLLIIVLTLTWTLSLIAATGHALDIISSLLPPILAAICMSDVVHISTHYIEQLRAGYDKKVALNKTYREIGIATFYTCCTVAAGFISLGITNIIPIRNFGFFAAAGIFFGFIITLVLLYDYYLAAPSPRVASLPGQGKAWDRLLTGSFRFVLKYKTGVLASLFVLGVVSVFYASRIQVNSSLLDEIPRKNPILNDYQFMEKDFSGTRPFELSLSVRDSSTSLLEPVILEQAGEAESFLKDSCGIGNVISPLSLFRGAHKAFNGGDPDSFSLPRTQEQVARYYEAIGQTEFAEELRHYMSPDGRQFRISGRLPNISVKEFEALRQKIDSFFDDHKNHFAFTHKHTGSALMLDKINYSLVNNLTTGILFDTFIICLIAFLLLRRKLIIAVILIPNLMPLLFMAGLMGLMGIHLKADTSVIFAIALGLAVDDSIHFLSRLRLELSRGKSLVYAVKRTYLSTGKAIIITTLVLLSGFLPLLSSSFGGTFYIGLLMSLCLFSAMLMELTVTPLLVLLLLGGKNKPAKGLVSKK
ncbi:MAG: efflux RND transporter permease subunit [Chitinophagaceae bacterium]